LSHSYPGWVGWLFAGGGGDCDGDVEITEKQNKWLDWFLFL
jgi:hypothetical protein